ncbi:Beta-galactosidase [Paenibacillus sp. JJ-100]|uniref:glycoside hydrolase family 2 protein n=1 Tax=Paenibacillus sp. JJ-100 TaxID=2974896 RepID=UPI0022FF6EEE|nr:sugar-binding domain-containing protein [Paenibacillus sp. JJ-100]CAI6084428.1 Beta-galactosidase [Paenibacillus sp. JJ-100]
MKGWLQDMNQSDVMAVRGTMNLNGTWQFQLAGPAGESGEQRNKEQKNPPHRGDASWNTIQVPGSWEEQGYGQAPGYARIDTWTKVREYEGLAWYAQDIDVPSNAQQANYVFRLRGVRWTSRLWFNGNEAGVRDSLLTEQTWDVTPWVIPGESNRVEILVDNTMKLPLAGSHIHSLHTATAWGGITGGALLEMLPLQRVHNVRIEPDMGSGTITVQCAVSTPVAFSASPLQLLIDIQHPDGTWLKRQSCEIDLDQNQIDLDTEVNVDGSSRADREVYMALCSIALGDEHVIVEWSDENPALYRAVVRLQEGEQELDQVEQRFGMRSFAANGKQLVLNGTPVFLRGYVDCCIFPLTGYPVWDYDHYVRQFRIAKSYGFNHVRLHGWSPPEPFWEAADEEGMLVQAELPHWSRFFEQQDVPAPVEIRTYLTQELDRLLETLHRHPSFVLFSLGNELIGANGHPELNALIERAREKDPSRLYTDNTGFGQLPAQGRETDYYIQSFNWHPPLESVLAAMPDTTLNYQAVTRLASQPVIGHEHAQFTMYVRPQEREKYTGVLRPTWLESIEESLMRKGMMGKLERYQHATGIHLMRSLKEAMERVRRTPDAAGIQLLDIRDFPGQGHATTGFLDVFWDDKGITTPDEVKQFNMDVVVLLSSKARTYYAGEMIEIDVIGSHYGKKRLEDVTVHWRMVTVTDEHILSEGTWNCEDIPCGSVMSLGSVKVSAPIGGATAFRVEAELRCRRAREDSAHSIVHSSNRLATVTIARNYWYGWSFPLMKMNSERRADMKRIWNTVKELQPLLVQSHEDRVDHVDGFRLLKQGDHDLLIVKSLTSNVLDYLLNGGRVWLHPSATDLYDPVETKYLPVFWNYLMFATQTGATMGMQMEEEAAFLGDFPQDCASDWHWYHLVNGTPAICLDTVQDVTPLIEVVDHFHRAKRLAYVFEARAGKGRLLVSSFPFTDTALMKRPEAAYLFQEMLSYVCGEQFQPESTITVAELLGMFKLQPIQFTL